MSGVQIVTNLLLGDDRVTAIAPESDIHAGTLPQNTRLPALSIETTSEVDREELAGDDWRAVLERVTMTAFGPDYGTAHDLLKAGKRACLDKFPEVAGFRNVSVVSGGGGPEGWHVAANCPSRSYDFLVGYEEPT